MGVHWHSLLTAADCHVSFRPVMKWSVFTLLLVARLLAAKYSIIADCDEVFNYWEPTHLVTHGFGLETWEYSPVYAIRSWAYVFLHSVPIYMAKYVAQLPFLNANVPENVYFGVLRVTLALVSALVETALYTRLASTISKRVAKWYLVFSLFSTGMFQASVSYLPSSFAMYCVTYALAEAASLPQNRGAKLVSVFTRSMTAVGIGALLGWPFCAAVGLPIALRFVYVCFQKSPTEDPEQHPLVTRVFAPVCYLSAAAFAILLRLVPLLLGIVLVDSFMYNKEFTIVPFNIVAYNVLNADADAGPEIFGVEPWTYYFMNLALNFNVVLILALVSCVAVLFKPLHVSRGHIAMLLSPFFMWLAIFTATPHKEERFMYVVYPALCMNAAFAFDIVILLVQLVSRIVGLARISRVLKTFARVSIVLGFIVVSLSRSAALSYYYGAPTKVYEELSLESSSTDELQNVCVGREWYRYPSSYFLQDSQRLKFVSSGFSGLLPGEFIEPNQDHRPVWDSTSFVPLGMNNRNEADSGKLVQFDQCDYYVDSDIPVDREIGEVSIDELASDADNWRVFACHKFLNKEESSGLGQKFWLPAVLHPITKTRLFWSNYCIAARR